MTTKTSFVDCDAGRRLGCATFCCRLWIRMSDETAVSFGGDRGLPKGDDGLCTHLDRESSLCSIWDKRPSVCREYDCNHDDLLQVVLKEGFTSLKQVVTSQVFIPKECYVKIPMLDMDNKDDC